MAKCVVCKAENAEKEAARHPNGVTLQTAKILRQRANKTSRKEQPQRFCERHSPVTPKVQKEDSTNVATV